MAGVGIADQFSDNPIDEFKEAFTLFDRNKDGTIYEAQVVLVMKALGIHANEMDLKVIYENLIIFYPAQKISSLERSSPKFYASTVTL